jgi:membrane associated rhomboid family serine protease
MSRNTSDANHASRVVHRLNLFPLTHLNFFHMIFNLVAVTPLIERFESEYGTLVTLALFTGRT